MNPEDRAEAYDRDDPKRFDLDEYDG